MVVDITVWSAIVGLLPHFPKATRFTICIDDESVLAALDDSDRIVCPSLETISVKTTYEGILLRVEDFRRLVTTAFTDLRHPPTLVLQGAVILEGEMSAMDDLFNRVTREA